MEVPAPEGILRTADCSSATLSENEASWVTFSSKAKTERRSPGRSTWRIKWAAASCSKLISLWALRLESIMMARSRGWEVSDSNLSIFCSTPSSKSWKASLGRSGAGRFLSSRTLTRTLTRFTLMRMRPRWEAGSCESPSWAGGVGWTIFPGSPSGTAMGAAGTEEVVLDLGVELAVAVDFGFCAQGGRSDWAWLKAIPEKSSAGTVSSKAGWGRKGVIDIGSYDAGFARGVATGAGGSSPSAQTAPSSKYSFFQMGTVRLRVSIAKRQASKAAARCGALTAMNTLVSPIARRPSRWTMATQWIRYFSWSWAPISRILARAMDS